MTSGPSPIAGQPQGPGPVLNGGQAQSDHLSGIPTRSWSFRPESPDWMRGVVTLVLVGVLVALIFSGQQSGAGWSAVVGFTGAATAYFFKK